MRQTLQSNYQHWVNEITEYFPADTKISRPQGGLAAWVEFNKKINAAELYDRAIKQKISISPGRLFTLQNQFENCMRISLGLTWTDELRQKLKILGGIVGRM